MRDAIVARYQTNEVPHGEFVSVGSTLEASFLDDNNVLIRMVISLKSPSGAKEISDLADGIHYRNNPRSELLFPAGTTFKVDNVFELDANGIITIILTEL